MRKFPIWKMSLVLTRALIVFGISSLFFCQVSKAQQYELLCPVGFRAVDYLTSLNQSTGKYRQNYCVDANGNIFENNIGAAVPGGPPPPGGSGGGVAGNALTSGLTSPGMFLGGPVP